MKTFHGHLSNSVILIFRTGVRGWQCVSIWWSEGKKKLKTMICQWTEVQRRGGSRITFISFGNWNRKDSNVLLHLKVSLVWMSWRAGVFDLAMFSLSHTHTHKPRSSSTPVLFRLSFPPCASLLRFHSSRRKNIRAAVVFMAPAFVPDLWFSLHTLSQQLISYGWDMNMKRPDKEVVSKSRLSASAPWLRLLSRCNHNNNHNQIRTRVTHRYGQK